MSLTVFLAVLAAKGVGKAVETISEESTKGAIDWLKSLFYKDGKPKKILEDLKNNPKDETLQKKAEAIIENSSEDNEKYKSYLDEILKAYSSNNKPDKTVIQNIKNPKNTVIIGIIENQTNN